MSIRDPFTDEAVQSRPRNIAAKAEAYLKSTGIADTTFFAPEAGVPHLRLGAFRDQAERRLLLLHRLGRGKWNSGGRTRTVAQPRIQDPYKGGYFPVPPVDHYADPARPDDLTLAEVGLSVERALPRGGHRGRAEINYRFDTWPRPPTTS